MSLDLVTLDHARAESRFGEESFEQSFPGVFLVALGLLKTRQAEEGVPAAQPLARGAVREPDLDLEATLSLSYGERLTHAMQDHPLAGCAFFLPFDAAEEPQVIGRKVGSDLTVPDVSVSDKHCAVRLDGRRNLVVTDLGTTNGTSIDALRLKTGVPLTAANEQILTVGRYAFQFLHARTLFKALQEL